MVDEQVIMLEVWCTNTSLVGQMDNVTAYFAQFKVRHLDITTDVQPA